ncbi:hypothetical protein [Metabacillus fastidiosus]|nr:hypothetical protein [Metabacillus fastidiosus]
MELSVAEKELISKLYHENKLTICEIARVVPFKRIIIEKIIEEKKEPLLR